MPRTYLLTFLWAFIVADMIYFLIVDTRDSIIAWVIALALVAPFIYLRHRKRVR